MPPDDENTVHLVRRKRIPYPQNLWIILWTIAPAELQFSGEIALL
jgi:hypothetical protein